MVKKTPTMPEQGRVGRHPDSPCQPLYPPGLNQSLVRTAFILTAGGPKRAGGGSPDGRCDLRGLTATALGDGG